MKQSFINNYRLSQVKEDEKRVLNWLFLPGGPGMGAEYIINFAGKLTLPGNLFAGDFPGDGSNRDSRDIGYESWKSGLLEVLKQLEPCVLVTHSFSGMFTLTIPEIENLVHGLVLISSVPDHRWMMELGNTQKVHKLPDISYSAAQFYGAPTDERLKLLFEATAPYLFASHEMQDGKEILDISPYNARAKLWADQNFHPFYKSSWIPNILPTIIIGSNEDRLLPIKFFHDQKDWDKENITILQLENTGHFPWLSHLDSINDALLKLAKNIR